MFSKEDIRQIEARGASLQQIQEQIERFKKGFPSMIIVGAAVPGRGIKVLTQTETVAGAQGQ